jgi:hypothetical protein
MAEPTVGRVIYRSTPIATEQRDGIPFNQATFAVRPRRVADVEPQKGQETDIFAHGSLQATFRGIDGVSVYVQPSRGFADAAADAP